QTYATNPEGDLSAYTDNAAVIDEGFAFRFLRDPISGNYYENYEAVALVLKAETHNHPTGIAPFPGAATGSGGEIRDEAATGRGAKPKVGWTGYSVSRIAGTKELNAQKYTRFGRMASPEQIMTEAPLGAARYNNEFGRPNVAGYYRSFEYQAPSGQHFGYHKPAMLAGGLGTIRHQHVQKQMLTEGMLLIGLGGPSMRIGLGGGAASSVGAGESSYTADFASVQRDNAEMQRRAQEVIDACWSLGTENPIISIHDVGAGGFSNACAEIVHDSHRGGVFNLRAILSADSSLSPMELWSNESQERYVLAITPERWEEFAALCRRERCPVTQLGVVKEATEIVVEDPLLGPDAVHLPNDVLFGKAPKLHLTAHTLDVEHVPVTGHEIPLDIALERVLQHPSVADKTFLITIGDRSVGGLVARDQMVGPWQVPVADCAVSTVSYADYSGEAIGLGERSPIAIVNPEASTRMAVAEAVLNMCAAPLTGLKSIRASANWMAAPHQEGQGSALYLGVRALSNFCSELGICIPVGKDSLSMQSKWRDTHGTEHTVFSPLTCVVSAVAPIPDVRRVLTPLVDPKISDRLWLLDLSHGRQRLGGSIYAQVIDLMGHEAPDAPSTERFKLAFEWIQHAHAQGFLKAYHDRSDGGVWATLMEMAFASHVGLSIFVPSYAENNPAAWLLNEELGIVFQMDPEQEMACLDSAEKMGLRDFVLPIARVLPNDETISVHAAAQVIYQSTWTETKRLWSAHSHHMQAQRDNPECAQQAYESATDFSDPGLSLKANYAYRTTSTMNSRPRVAILREQGVNGHMEMAAAFTKAGMTAVDVPMQDLIDRRKDLSDFQLLAACGGFSYGDVLGAGRGWASTILYHPVLREMFQGFFERPDTLTLGVCNGCQMLSHLKELIPGADHWPTFLRNRSEQFEARLAMVRVEENPSVFFADMIGAELPIIVAHGEGRVVHPIASNVALRYVNNQGSPTDRYPANPNGSAQGIAGVTSTDGRATILMPHPERLFRSTQWSWYPGDKHVDESPWLRFFCNGRQWIEDRG
ncbi:MAG: phosphoribosylformylglycinamidine synthase, partial [Pseudomonadota bacterium]